MPFHPPRVGANALTGRALRRLNRAVPPADDGAADLIRAPDEERERRDGGELPAGTGATSRLDRPPGAERKSWNS